MLSVFTYSPYFPYEREYLCFIFHSLFHSSWAKDVFIYFRLVLVCCTVFRLNGIHKQWMMSPALHFVIWTRLFFPWKSLVSFNVHLEINFFYQLHISKMRTIVKCNIIAIEMWNMFHVKFKTIHTIELIIIFIFHLISDIIHKTNKVLDNFKKKHPKKFEELQLINKNKKQWTKWLIFPHLFFSVFFLSRFFIIFVLYINEQQCQNRNPG